MLSSISLVLTARSTSAELLRRDALRAAEISDCSLACHWVRALPTDVGDRLRGDRANSRTARLSVRSLLRDWRRGVPGVFTQPLLPVAAPHVGEKNPPSRGAVFTPPLVGLVLIRETTNETI